MSRTIIIPVTDNIEEDIKELLEKLKKTNEEIANMTTTGPEGKPLFIITVRETLKQEEPITEAVVETPVIEVEELEPEEMEPAQDPSDVDSDVALVSFSIDVWPILEKYALAGVHYLVRAMDHSLAKERQNR